MSAAPKDKAQSGRGVSWQPSTSLQALRARAELLAQVRHFFQQRAVLEVETPLRGQYTVTASHLASLAIQSGGYLQTSPEYAMKRLLAAGSGCIYQICKSFRRAERGRYHNSEFTILEWYRCHYTQAQLMAEVTDLLQQLLGELPVRHISYREAFLRHANIDPFTAADEALLQRCQALGCEMSAAHSRDDCLDVLLSHCVQPQLGRTQEAGREICFLLDFPASQAALAQTEFRADENIEVALRFEVFIDGVELANAYVELSDAQRLAARWEEDRRERQHWALEDVLPDTRLLAAQRAGLPACAGVAMGLDRVLMLQLDANCIDEVIAFCDEHA